MPLIASNRTKVVNVALTGGRVTSGFRAALFDAASRAGLSVNEYVLQATAERLRTGGYRFPGVFADGHASPPEAA